MQPLYKLRLGIPGRSWAIETAARLGLSRHIIDDSVKNLGEDQVRMDQLLANIEAKEGAVDLEKAELTRTRESAAQELERLKKLRLQISEERQRLKDEFQIAMQRAETRAVEKLNALMEEYKAKIANLPILQQEMREAKRKIVELRKEFDTSAAPKPDIPSTVIPELPPEIEAEAPELVRGATVRIKNLNMTGVLLSDPKDQNKAAEVQVGSMKMKAPWKQIEARALPQKPKPKAAIYVPERDPCPPELNLLGLRVDDAIQRLEEYVDRASQSALVSVRIIHGHGTGALKKAVREHLKRSHYDFRWRTGAENEGGDGCTVIELQDV